MADKKIKLQPQITFSNGSSIRTVGDSDGVALQSAVHPGRRPHWYDWLVMMFARPVKMSPESIEKMEIEIRGR